MTLSSAKLRVLSLVASLAAVGACVSLESYPVIVTPEEEEPPPCETPEAGAEDPDAAVDPDASVEAEDPDAAPCTPVEAEEGEGGG